MRICLLRRRRIGRRVFRNSLLYNNNEGNNPSIFHSLTHSLSPKTNPSIIPILTRNTHPRNKKPFRIPSLLNRVQLLIIVSPEWLLKPWFIRTRLVQISPHILFPLNTAQDGNLHIRHVPDNSMLLGKTRIHIPTAREDHVSDSFPPGRVHGTVNFIGIGGNRAACYYVAEDLRRGWRFYAFPCIG